MLLCGPLHQPGFLWAEHFKVLVPFIAINIVYSITRPPPCQELSFLQKCIPLHHPPCLRSCSISRALARESSVTWSPEMRRAKASTRPFSSNGWISV